MARGAIRPKRRGSGELRVDVTPVIGRRIARVDTRRLDQVDLSQHRFDQRNLHDTEQNFGAVSITEERGR